MNKRRLALSLLGLLALEGLACYSLIRFTQTGQTAQLRLSLGLLLVTILVGILVFVWLHRRP